KFRVGSSHVAGVEASLLRSTMAHLRELYKELLAPIDSQLEAAHLIVVPHGVLHYVPFHALADGEHYLIDRMSISYAPSGSVYALCCSKEVNTDGPAVVLGIPDEQAPSITEEVHALGHILGDSEVYVGSEANHQVLKSRGRAARIVHIAS